MLLFWPQPLDSSHNLDILRFYDIETSMGDRDVTAKDIKPHRCNDRVEDLLQVCVAAMAFIVDGCWYDCVRLIYWCFRHC